MRSLTVELPNELRWDPLIQKSVHESLPYFVPGFTGATFESSRLIVSFSDGSVQDSGIYQSILSLVERTSTSFRDVIDRQISVSDGQPKLTMEDPFDALVAEGSVTPTGSGKFVYAKSFLTLFEAFDDKVKEFCISQGALKELYPTTVKTQSLIDAGYLNLSPQLAYFAAPVHFDQASLVKIGKADILDVANRESTISHLGLPDQVLAPTVCYHCFEARKNSTIQAGVITSLNKCHRHEVVNVRSLERLTTYWMRELIAFGSPKDVQMHLDESLSWTTGLLNDWGIWHEVISASDPFFADMGSSNRLFQAAFMLKRELKLPVLSGRKIAAASFNSHLDTLVSKFNVSTDILDEQFTFHSGCVGWGYERFLYGLFCQLGTDLSKWPSSVKRSLNL